MMQQQQPLPQQSRGNLENALNSYNIANNANNKQQSMQPISEEQPDHPSLLTIQIPGSRIQQQQQPIPSPLELDRIRSSTLGSEFDSLSWVKDRGMSISCLLTPLGEMENDVQLPPHVTVGGGTATHSEGTCTSATVSTSSTNNTVPVALHPMPSLTERNDERMASDSAHDSLFISDNKQQQEREQMNSTLFSHTPPTDVATSYEQRHFQKRMRAGSISGRLRSASDLEDIGIINNDQKAILKDLLIAGNDQVQAAIDKYEAGDASALEEMIHSGAFSKSVDVDLLGDLDLDLDFLNVHEDDGLVFGNMEDIVGEGQHHQQHVGQRGVGSRKQVGKVLEPASVKSEELGVHSYHEPDDNGVGQHEEHASQDDDDADDGVNRIRTNSLAFPGMMLDGASQDYTLGDFGQWMDSDLPQLMNSTSSKQAHDANAPVINADGSSSSFKLQCDLLMQKEGDHCYSSSPAAVASILMDKPLNTKNKAASAKASPNVKQDNKKKPQKKKEAASDKKKPKKKPLAPTEVYSTSTIPFIKRDRGGDEDSDDNKEVPSGLGKPRSMSDPNLTVRLDELGHLHVNGPKGWVGAYSPDSREIRINRFLEKRNHRVWVKKVKYDVRKNFADSRLRVKGRFVKKEDEMLMRELMSLT